MRPGSGLSTLAYRYRLELSCAVVVYISMRYLLPLLATAVVGAVEPSYTLHEWGVFTITPGNPFAQQDYREEWASFPSFFTKQPPIPQAKAGVAVRKPVVYLQADGDQRVDLAFTLRGGTPLVWWPDAVATGETLRFTVQVLDKQAERSASPDMSSPPVPAGHWIEHLRAVGSDYLKPVMLEGRRKNPANTSAMGDSFLYYDGLIPALATPTVTFVGAEKHEHWQVTNTAAYPLHDAILVYVRHGKVHASPWLDTLASNASAALPLWPNETQANQDATKMPLPMQLQLRLAAAGLSTAESTSLVACWKEELFTHDGLTLIYRLPQDTYDQVLPLAATPQPKQTVRVGLVVHQHLEPTLAADVNALIDALAKAEEADRPALMTQLKAYGGAAFPMLRARITANDPEALVCRRLLAEQELAAP